jgi:hypothetical protein
LFREVLEVFLLRFAVKRKCWQNAGGDINKSFAAIVNVKFRQQRAELRMAHEDFPGHRKVRSVNAIKIANYN